MNKKYVITISSINPGDGEDTRYYEQTVETLDIRKVIEAVNAQPSLEIPKLATPRKRAQRSDKGKKRTGKTTGDFAREIEEREARKRIKVPPGTIIPG